MTMSRKKVVKNLEDLDELTQFLEKVREMIYSHNYFMRAALMGGEEDTKVTVGMVVMSICFSGLFVWCGVYIIE